MSRHFSADLKPIYMSATENKIKSAFVSEDALMKILYLAAMNITEE